MKMKNENEKRKRKRKKKEVRMNESELSRKTMLPRLITIFTANFEFCKATT